MGLPDGENSLKIYLLVSIQDTDVTDGQKLHNGISHAAITLLNYVHYDLKCGSNIFMITLVYPTSLHADVREKSIANNDNRHEIVEN